MDDSAYSDGKPHGRDSPVPCGAWPTDERGTWQPRHTNSHYLQSVYCNGIYYIILGGGGRENKDVDRAPVYQPGAEKDDYKILDSQLRIVP